MAIRDSGIDVVNVGWRTRRAAVPVLVARTKGLHSGLQVEGRVGCAIAPTDDSRVCIAGIRICKRAVNR